MTLKLGIFIVNPMFIHEKIKVLIDQQNLNRAELHRKIKAEFGKKAITYLTLGRILSGERKVREASLAQIARALGISVHDIKKDTDRQENFIRHDYNKKTYLEIDNLATNNLESNLLIGRLILLSKGKTPVQQDPAQKGKFVKYIHGLHGTIQVIVNSREGLIKKDIKYGESFHFDSTQPHYFENNTKRKAACLLIQNPKSI